MNMPYQDYVDSATMKLIHARFEAMGHNKKKQRSYLRPVLLQYNDRQSKFYTHNLKVIKNGRLHAFAGLWGLPKAPEYIIETYEEMKQSFTDKLNEKITRDAKLLEQGEPIEKVENRKELTGRQESVLKTLASIKEPNKQQLAGEKLGITQATVSEALSYARKKGWSVRDFMEDTE